MIDDEDVIDEFALFKNLLEGEGRKGREEREWVRGRRWWWGGGGVEGWGRERKTGREIERESRKKVREEQRGRKGR